MVARWVEVQYLFSGSNHTFLWPKSKRYNRDSLGEAMDHVGRFDADYGRTETYRANEAVVEHRFGDLEREVSLLTDGDIRNQEIFFEYLNQNSRKKYSNFSLGLGEGVAAAGKGLAQCSLTFQTIRWR